MVVGEKPGPSGMLPWDPCAEMAFYIRHLKETVLPFWLANGIDREHGGYFTCFSNDGGTRTGTDKFTWSQGRMVWILSELSSMPAFSLEEREQFLGLARAGADFLTRHCVLPNGNCAFLTDRNGTPLLPPGETAYDTSIYADCFVILGLARLAARSMDREALAFALDLYRRVMGRFESGQYPTQPYPEVPGYRTHPMIELGIAQEMAWATAAFSIPGAEALSGTADAFVHKTLNAFLTPEFLLLERIRDDGTADTEHRIGRYVNPGHTVEWLWFLLHQAYGMPAGDPVTGQAIGSARPDGPAVAETAAKIFKSTFRAGWDGEHGGLLLFADRDGGEPKGSTAGMEREPMVRKVVTDWPCKLWWPHSEALYTALLLYRLTGDGELLGMYRQVFEYTFRTFPNPDQSIGEWIQIRDRQGNPDNRTVALPVKDPYHIIRNLILLIRLLEGWNQLTPEGLGD